MATLLKKAAVSQQEGTTPMVIMSTFAEELKNWKTASRSKSGMSINLFDGENNMVSLVLSKNLQVKLNSGEVAFNQLGHCNIIESANAAGELRYRLVLPNETGIDATALLAEVTSGAKLQVNIAKSFTVPASQVNEAL